MPRRSINRADAAPEPDLIAGQDAGSNVPELSVSELSGALKRTVEERFGFVRLRGEVSNYRGPHSSGHAYFSLKDEGARIDAVVWRTAFARMRIKPEDGMEVVATGKITTFPGKSSYQIVIESLEPAGIGALMAILEERRLRLAAEGLFDAARKQALPFLPGVIGVVTSPTGAVIRDILHRVAARFPRHVLVWPVRVQGESSGAEVAAAIRGFNALGAGDRLARPHLIIVARGGGSLEDLWGFNDEAVVRAVAESVIPLISAVGHETDWTLIDHVADLRAPTPTGAAELALPVLQDLTVALERLRLRQRTAALAQLDRRRTELRALLRHLPAGSEILSLPRQRLDRASGQLPAVTQARQDRLRLDLARWAARLGTQSPRAKMARTAERLIGLGDRLGRARERGAERRKLRLDGAKMRLQAGFAAQLRHLRSQHTAKEVLVKALGARLERARGAVASEQRQRLARTAQLMQSLSYRSVLARGYAVVRDEHGATVGTAVAFRRMALVSVEFADDRVAARPEPDGPTLRSTTLAPRPARPRRQTSGTDAPSQRSLFET
ncbi:exodeoxyribonuclease VII large subunit [Lichenifustis flavocetrariae]|uniref:Exodeoxyribonuclease 7 large subunit n=1 Tax=Lichenifustis flavocetrariae TaxID=2949735 RepID=A0AA41Z055_9HYPH|nr:exodeoxyribonuclease VII large subunit [Lichenifustis flavocetrariae]MCW6510333.1 exodeoxyribonuclease VII large subunit [Lichenifustis flavocetrariae]